MRVANTRSIDAKRSGCQQATGAWASTLKTYGETGVSDAPIHAIHRGDRGAIPLARKKDKGLTWEPLGALTVGAPLLPELFRLLARDAYFGLNSSYGKPAPKPVERKRSLWQPIAGQPHNAGARSIFGCCPRGEEQVTVTTRTWTMKHPTTGLPLVEHSNSTLRWLNVAYADLDCYKLNLTVGDALGALVTMQDNGDLPPVSLLARSGRGLWAFWLLRDVLNPDDGERLVHGAMHKPNTPQRATRHALRDYAAVQSAIVRKLEHLGADLGAVDGPRYAPVPGTKKTKAGSSQVLYWIQATDNGIPSYTLPELKAALNVQDAPAHPKIDAAFSKAPLDAQQQHGKRGHRQRWAYVVLELEALFTLRNGYGNATSRHQAALWHAAALKRSGIELPEVKHRVREFWQRSRYRRGDVLVNADLDDVLKQAAKKQTQFTRLRRETYLRALNVTDAELSYMDAAANRRTPPPPPAAARQQQRLDAILQAVNDTFEGKPPSVRAMCEHLSCLGLDSGNHSTVHRDYRHLGIKPAGKPGRRRQPKLPEMEP